MFLGTQRTQILSGYRKKPNTNQNQVPPSIFHGFCLVIPCWLVLNGEAENGLNFFFTGKNGNCLKTQNMFWGQSEA